MGRKRRPRPKLTRDEIVAGLRALARAQLGVQVTHASQTQRGRKPLPQQKRKQVKDQIKLVESLKPPPPYKHKEKKEKMKEEIKRPVETRKALTRGTSRPNP